MNWFRRIWIGRRSATSLTTWIVRATTLACMIFASAAPALAARPGDKGVEPDPSRYDPRYPDMPRWASAGVRGGIPPRDALKVVETVKPGGDIQSAIEAAGKKGGGVVLLARGVYPLSRRLDLASGVVLRGEDRDKVVLEANLRADKPSAAAVAIRFDGVNHAGIEDLTVRHAEVAKRGMGVYAERVAGPRNDPGGVRDLHVGGVVMERAEDCWIDNCFILHSGADPLDVQGERITLRDTLIDGAFNKGAEGGPAGSGNVYFAVDNGLIYNTTIRNVRHALVMRDTLAGKDCKFNVILDCNFESDVNFHGNRKDEGHNLFEGTLVYSPPSHGWPAWSYWKRADIGPDNLVYKSIGWGGSRDDAFSSTDPTRVYTFTGLRDPNILAPLDKPAPRAETLYAATAQRLTAIETLGPWPKSPAAALALLRKRQINPPAAP